MRVGPRRGFGENAVSALQQVEDGSQVQESCPDVARSKFRIGAAAGVPQSQHLDRRLTGYSVVKVIMNASEVNATHIF